MPALTDFDISDLAELFSAWGFKPSHARRLLRAFYLAAGRPDIHSLRLGKALERILQSDGAASPILRLNQSAIRLRTDAADGTVKLLIGLEKGGSVESVLMPAYDGRRAAGCVSSQIGCAMGCDFCASTRHGLERNLASGEIVEQFLHLRALSATLDRRLSTLVFMGMGEPMHNLENVIAAIRRIAAPEMGNLGFRNITVSTVGIVPGIRRLAAADLNVHLALSLHGPDDDTRGRIVPANRRYPVAEIVTAARDFQRQTGRIVTIEYCLLGGINDSDLHARRLAELIGDWRAHVNLIPYNSIGAGLSGRVYERPSAERTAAFLSILRDRNVVVHCRRPRGDDVAAACGQLRALAAAP